MRDGRIMLSATAGFAVNIFVVVFIADMQVVCGSGFNSVFFAMA